MARQIERSNLWRAPRLAMWIALIALLGIVSGGSLAAQDYAPGSVRMIITYRCRPADRPALLAVMRKDGIARFDRWKSEGRIADYLPLFNTVCDTGTWDMMMILSFSDYRQTSGWYDIEEQFPGGLSPELLKIASPTATQLAEARWNLGTAGSRKSAIYMIIPYDHPNRDIYVNFVNSVLVPQFDGWMKEKALRAWSIMLTNHYPGRPHDLWLLLEYDGIEGLAHRNSARDATARRLDKDSSWHLLREISEGFRSEHEVTIARAVIAE